MLFGGELVSYTVSGAADLGSISGSIRHLTRQIEVSTTGQYGRFNLLP